MRSSSLLMGAGIGAAAMFFVDPARGARRRSMVRDKAAGAARKTSSGAAALARDVSQRTYGAWAGMQKRLRQAEVTDETLVERVRAKLGRYVSHPHAIDVYAQNGCVELRGVILKREIERLISAVERVPGVCGLDNHLEAHDTAGNIPSLQGGVSPKGDAYAVMRNNWPPATRMAMGTIGSALVGYGVSRRDVAGNMLLAAGAGLVVRAASNLETKRLVGIGAGRRAVDIQKTIHLDAPIDLVFDFWQNLENFPRFMRNVRDVRMTSIDGQSHWVVAGPGQVPIEFDAVITKLIPNRVLAWKTMEGAPVAHAGVVRFDEDRALGTRVQIRLSYNPPAGALGHVLAGLIGEDPKSKIDGDLARMKTLIETGNPPRDAAQPMQKTPDALM